jgi:RhoGAP domain
VALDTPIGGALYAFEGRTRPKRPTRLFGSPLKDVVMDDKRCSVCYMDSRLGVPSMIISMITFLTAHIDTPGLFRQRVPQDAINILRRSLELEQGIPTTFAGVTSTEFTVHVVAQTLLHWLYELPEPLFGYEHYDAILACLEMEGEEHRLRNLTLLIQETPWYAQPLLTRVLPLLNQAVSEEHSAKNGLSLVAMAVLCTPFLLRPEAAPGQPSIIFAPNNLGITSADSLALPVPIADGVQAYNTPNSRAGRGATGRNTPSSTRSLEDVFSAELSPDVDEVEEEDMSEEAKARIAAAAAGE